MMTSYSSVRLDLANAGASWVDAEVQAAGVNFPDTLIIEGKYQFKPPFPFAPGGEVEMCIRDRVVAGCWRAARAPVHDAHSAA